MKRFLLLFIIFFVFYPFFPKPLNNVEKLGSLRKEKREKIFKLKKQIHNEEKYQNFSRLGKLYYELGNSYVEIDDYLSSLKAFYMAKGFFEKLKGDLLGNTYLDISEIFRIMGRMGVSEKYLKKAYELSLKLKKDHLMIKIYNLYGDMAFDKDELSEALNFYQQSIGLSARNGLFPEMVETSYRIALLYIKSGDKNLGMRILKDVIDNSLLKRYYNNLLPKIFQYVKRLIKYDRIEEASKYLKQMDDIFAPFFKEYYFYDYLSGLVLEKSGKRYRALKYYRRAIYGLDKLFAGMESQIHYNNKVEIVEIYTGIAKFFFEMFDLTNKTGYLKQAVYISEIKNSYIYKWGNEKRGNYNFIRSDLNRIENSIKNLTKKIRKLLKEDENPGALTESEKKLKMLNQQRMDVAEFLRLAPLTFKKYKYKDLNSAGIRSLLDNESVILKFVVLSKYIYVIVIDRDSIGYKKIETPKKIIFRDIKKLLRPFRDFSKGRVDLLHVKYDMKLSNTIYKNLLFDILEFQKDKKILYIIPDSDLFRLPFEALVTEIGKEKIDQSIYFSDYMNARFLTEKYSISYFFSLFHFRNRMHYGKKRYKISVFGAPEIENFIYSDLHLPAGIKFLGDIPSSLNEINDVKKIFGKKSGKYFTRKNFTVRNFIENASKSQIIHLATHFIHNKYFPGYSSLIFSGEEDGKFLLYSSDISKLKLNCDLVVLSACESAEENLMGEQSLKGIASSFYKAGVKSLIVSFWPVDQFSSKIMPYFYSRIIKKVKGAKGLTRILNVVKNEFMKKTLEIRKGVKISFRHPLFWANFVLYNFSM